MLFPKPKLPWVKTYKTPEGRDEELPQLSRNTLRAHIPTSAMTPPIFFDIYSPKGSSIGALFAKLCSQPLPVRGRCPVSRHGNWSLWLKYICVSGMSGKSKPRRSRNPDFNL